MKVLLLDSDRRSDRVLQDLFSAGELSIARTQAEGLRLASTEPWDAILLDADFSGAGMELLPHLRSARCGPIILLARAPSLELTLEAIRDGAHDVIAKPIDPERLREILGGLELTRSLRPLPQTPARGDALVGTSPEMLAAFKQVARAAKSDASVLLLGESGTGKEMVARVLHAQSARARQPFVAINCAAIPENLLESELFGHEKGAFTGAIARRIGRFERAGGGTLFLDEIGDMSVPLQSKILRAIQEREIDRVGGSTPIPIDLRIIAATHRDLSSAVAAGEFREDLFYRLAVISIELPPLRSRPGDLELLVEHFAVFYAREHRRTLTAIADETMQILRRNRWPGNVRQLRNAIERAVVMCDGEVLLPEHLPPEVRTPGGTRDATPESREPLCTLAEMEKRLIRRALSESGRNFTVTAERLGIHRNTLRRKIAEYGLES